MHNFQNFLIHFYIIPSPAASVSVVSFHHQEKKSIQYKEKKKKVFIKS